MDTYDEWKMLVNIAERRQRNNVHMIEDDTLLEVNTLLNWLLERVTIDEHGEISLNKGDVKTSFINGITESHLCD